MNKIQRAILEQLYEILGTARRGIIDGHYTLDLDEFDEADKYREFEYLCSKGYISKERHSKQWLYYISDKGINILKGEPTLSAGESGCGKRYQDLFKKFETKIRRISKLGDNAQFKDVLDKAKRINPVIEYKENLIWDLYGLRNVFSHCDRDKYIAEVNEFAFQELGGIIELLENPPKAKDLFSCPVFSARTDDFVENIVPIMVKEIYTHVPIYTKKHEFHGVLSEASIFLWLGDHLKGGNAIFNKKKIEVFDRKYLYTATDKCDFIPECLSIFEIQKMFDAHVANGIRLGALFITENGNKDEKITGIVTAWDLPKIRKFLE